MGKPLREFAIICEKKQTFSLRVQTPDVGRENFWGSRSNTVSRACSSFRVETNPAGLCSTMVNAGATRTSLPSTLTWSCALGCALKFVQTLPLMVTRLAAINSSQCRRDPTPAAARKRLRRKNELQE